MLKSEAVVLIDSVVGFEPTSLNSNIEALPIFELDTTHVVFLCPHKLQKCPVCYVEQLSV